MRIWFIGSGAFAAACLAHMSERLEFEKIVTGHPTKSGRGFKECPSCVERTVEDLGLSVERAGPLSRDENLVKAVSRDPPDVIFVVDFGQLVKEPFLSAPRHGCLNIHPSLLPRWRGAAPIQRALMNGDTVIGVTVFRLVEELDAGPILARAELAVPPEATSADLFDILALAGSQTAVVGIESLIEGSYQFSDQNSEFATYAAKLTKDEAQVSWNQNYLLLHNTVRAFASSTGAFAMVLGKRVKLWRTVPVDAEGAPGEVLYFLDGDPVVACAEGAVRLQEVQSEGKRKISGADWACGGRLKRGGVLT
ncbi:MAG: methionyl-tRNA formyltransferase [Synergistaceae bacterium]|jgi:methionyl-tRNA formyltransferase|nr:methionyl-tRNA formyltransferase [Synergistaceae bacterium]